MKFEGANEGKWQRGSYLDEHAEQQTRRLELAHRVLLEVLELQLGKKHGHNVRNKIKQQFQTCTIARINAQNSDS